nr:ribonuclease H-like domain, reverse transcriptase, RNA-dependent DNA polymerase [Tanacetum cinerariifolium]
MLHMKEDETIDTFTGKLTTLVNKAANLGHTMEDETLVRKLLNAVPDRYLQIVASIEQYSDLSEMTLEEEIGRLKTYKEIIKYKKGKQVDNQKKLMFTRHENKGKYFRGRGHGKHRFSQGRNHENFKEEKKDGETSHRNYNRNNFKKSSYDTSKLQCYKCKKIGHIAPNYPQRTKPNEQSNLIQEDLEPTLLMEILEDLNKVKHVKEVEEQKVSLHEEDVGYKETNMDSLWICVSRDVKFKENETWDWKEYMTANNKWEVHHLDVKSAFLHRDLKEEVYVTHPEGFIKRQDNGKVYRLIKTLYGLRQASRAWNINLDNTLKSLDFKKCALEQAIYTKTSKDSTLLIGVYVYDLIITGTPKKEIDKFKAQMEEKFEMSDLELLAYYLGIEVTQTDGDISIKQSAYANKILNEARMLDCNETLIPMDPGTRLTKAIRQVLRNVKGTKDYGITYKHNGGNKIHGFSDSSYEVNTQEGKGTTRIILYYGESPISWSTQKQATVALSSCESEFIATSAAVTQALWLKRLLSKLTHSEEEKVTISVDNKSAIALMKNAIFHGRSKHIDTNLPSEIGYHLSNLVRLQLHGNELTGVLPPSISNCSKLRHLEMSYNNFSGMLTIDFSKLRDIKYIVLQNNNLHGRGEADDMSLSGTIPPEIKDLKMLSYLDLSHNNLSGNITSSLGECISLTMLNLSDNIFQGIIPSPLSSLRGLEVLDISKNDFEGEVPVVGVFSNASAFSVLGNNRLCGGLVTLELPKCKEMGSKKKSFPFFPSQSSGNERFLNVSYNELLKATDGFSNANLIGEGTFGYAPPEYGIRSEMTSTNAKKVEECLIATIKIGVSCSLDSPPQRMKIEIVVIELQRILDVLQNI